MVLQHDVVNVTTAITLKIDDLQRHTLGFWLMGCDGQIKTIINTSTSGTNAITITSTNLRGLYNYRIKRISDNL